MLAFDFDSPNIEVAEISEDKKYGRFVVEPLERGYGVTLGKRYTRRQKEVFLNEVIKKCQESGIKIRWLNFASSLKTAR